MKETIMKRKKQEWEECPGLKQWALGLSLFFLLLLLFVEKAEELAAAFFPCRFLSLQLAEQLTERRRRKRRSADLVALWEGELRLRRRAMERLPLLWKNGLSFRERLWLSGLFFQMLRPTLLLFSLLLCPFLGYGLYLLPVIAALFGEKRLCFANFGERLGAVAIFPCRAFGRGIEKARKSFSTQEESLFLLYKAMLPNSLVCLYFIAGFFFGNTLLLSALLAILFLYGPILSLLLPLPVTEMGLGSAERELLWKTCAAAWRYFTSFSGEDTGYLPPNRIQEGEEGPGKIGPRAAAFGMLGTVAAYDLGLLLSVGLLNRMAAMLDVMEERWLRETLSLEEASLLWIGLLLSEQLLSDLPGDPAAPSGRLLGKRAKQLADGLVWKYGGEAAFQKHLLSRLLPKEEGLSRLLLAVDEEEEMPLLQLAEKRGAAYGIREMETREYRVETQALYLARAANLFFEGSTRRRLLALSELKIQPDLLKME